MARGINRATVMGYLGKDPDMRYTSTGKPVVQLSIATSEGWKDKTTGELQERTEWHRVTLFNRLAEIANQYLKQGSLVMVEGSIRTDKFEDKKTGITRYNTQIIANNLQMIGGGQKNREASDQTASTHKGNSQNHQGVSTQNTSLPEPDWDNFHDDDIPF